MWLPYCLGGHTGWGRLEACPHSNSGRRQNGVGIAAAKTKRADPGQRLFARLRPRFPPLLDLQGQIVKGDVGVGCLEMEAGRQLAIM